MTTQTSIKAIALLRLLTITVLTVTTITACQDRVNRLSVGSTANSTSSSKECRNVEHEMGTTKVCGQPQRIVVLGPHYLDPLLSLGVQPAAYAELEVLHQGDYDRPSQQIPYLGDRITQPIANVGSAMSPSIEAILRVKPDLIIGSGLLHEQQYETFAQIAPTLLLGGIVTERETETTLRTIAQAVDRSPQAERVWQETQQQIATTRKKLAPLAAKYPKVLIAFPGQLQSIYLYNSISHCGSMLEKLGFKLVLPPGYERPEFNESPVSLEILPQLNEAELIILLGVNLREFDDSNNFKQSQLSESKQVWQKNAIAQSLDASQAGRIYFIPYHLCSAFPGAIGTKLYLEKLEQQLLPP
jgi:iron complex transport system substrate-binding protein